MKIEPENKFGGSPSALEMTTPQIFQTGSMRQSSLIQNGTTELYILSAPRSREFLDFELLSECGSKNSFFVLLFYFLCNVSKRRGGVINGQYRYQAWARKDFAEMATNTKPGRTDCSMCNRNCKIMFENERLHFSSKHFACWYACEFQIDFIFRRFDLQFSAKLQRVSFGNWEPSPRKAEGNIFKFANQWNYSKNKRCAFVFLLKPNMKNGESIHSLGRNKSTWAGKRGWLHQLTSKCGRVSTQSTRRNDW